MNEIKMTLIKTLHPKSKMHKIFKDARNIHHDKPYLRHKIILTI